MKNGPEAEIIKTDNHDSESLCLECLYKSTRPYPEIITDTLWRFYQQAGEELGVTLNRLNTAGDKYYRCDPADSKCNYEMFLLRSNLVLVDVLIKPDNLAARRAFDNRVMELAEVTQTSGLITTEKLLIISKRDGQLQKLKRGGFLLDDLAVPLSNVKYIRPNKVNGSNKLDLESL